VVLKPRISAKMSLHADKRQGGHTYPGIAKIRDTDDEDISICECRHERALGTKDMQKSSSLRLACFKSLSLIMQGKEETRTSMQAGSTQVDDSASLNHTNRLVITRRV